MPPAASASFEITAESQNLPPLRSKLRGLLESAGFDEMGSHNILLSVDEVLTNVIRHGLGGAANGGADGKIRISFIDQGDRVEIQVEDPGPCFDPRTLPPPKLPSEKPGGLGIYLVRSLMDEIDYEPLKPQGNRLRLVKYKNGKKERNLKP